MHPLKRDQAANDYRSVAVYYPLDSGKETKKSSSVILVQFPNKTEQTYAKFLKAIDIVSNNAQPSMSFLDFEPAAVNAFTYADPDSFTFILDPSLFILPLPSIFTGFKKVYTCTILPEKLQKRKQE